MADPRKFHEYVLVPDYPGGKDHIFLGTLGFRPHSAIDARELARLYEEQARERITSGNVQFARTNPYGDLYIIVIAVRGVELRTAWLHAGDEVRLVTPFSGFERDVPRG
jgi:hypothetical protein